MFVDLFLDFKKSTFVFKNLMTRVRNAAISCVRYAWLVIAAAALAAALYRPCDEQISIDLHVFFMPQPETWTYAFSLPSTRLGQRVDVRRLTQLGD